jgi:4-hydroxybenzoate polyprenyltransferase
MTICQNERNSFLHTYFFNSATSKLLQSSLGISISGTFRIYLASLLLGSSVSSLLCLAGGLVIYSVYTLDRALGCKEDLVNRSELNGSCKNIGVIVSVVTFLIGSFIFLQNDILWLAFFPFVTGYLYSKGLRLHGFNLRLKAGLGVKNLVVGLTWGIFLALVSLSDSRYLSSLVALFLLYGTKTFINSIIDDFKDIKGDTLAGIKTIPLSLGEQKTRNILLTLHIAAHLVLFIMCINGIILNPAIVVYSFLCGLVCILRYTNEQNYINRKYEMTFFKDGESFFTLLFIYCFNFI